MTRKHLKELIASGEGTYLEFKRKAASPIKIAKEVCAFANTSGGYLLVGIDDNGSIYGVLSEKSEIDIIQKGCEFFIEPPISPEIETIDVEGKEIVVVSVSESVCKPHKLIEEDPETKKPILRAYIRQGENSVIASREMTRLLASKNPDAKPVKLIIGDKEKRLFDYLDKYRQINVKEYAKLVNISDRRASQLLIRLVKVGAIQIYTDGSKDYFALP